MTRKIILPGSLLDFESFLREYYPDYLIDDINAPVIRDLSLWATRNPKFERPDEGLYLDKAILIQGNVGVGKTDLMSKARNYLRYLQSPYVFNATFVWKFAGKFSEIKYKAFTEHETGNWYYDELCFLDASGIPSREFAQHYSTKILVGAVLIPIRYEAFKQGGWQSSFTTNTNQEIRTHHYGEANESRLCEMCNIFSMVGKDRRKNIKPVFYKNYNNPQLPPSSMIRIDEVIEIKNRLNDEYKNFLQHGTVKDLAVFDYQILINYGCDLGTDDDILALLESVKLARKAEVDRISAQPNAGHRYRRLKSQYDGDNLDNEEKDFLWIETRKLAVVSFYQRCKEAGYDVIFKKKVDDTAK